MWSRIEQQDQPILEVIGPPLILTPWFECACTNANKKGRDDNKFHLKWNLVMRTFVNKNYFLATYVCFCTYCTHLAFESLRDNFWVPTNRKTPQWRIVQQPMPPIMKTDKGWLIQWKYTLLSKTRYFVAALDWFNNLAELFRPFVPRGARALSRIPSWTCAWQIQVCGDFGWRWQFGSTSCRKC